MDNNVVEYMISKNFCKTNSLIKATIKSTGVGGMPVTLDKDILYEDCAKGPHGTIYIKGCDPENLREYIVGSPSVHQINDMDESTIHRLFPEMQQ
jgi:hypothetical protein